MESWLVGDTGCELGVQLLCRLPSTLLLHDKTLHLPADALAQTREQTRGRKSPFWNQLEYVAVVFTFVCIRRGNHKVKWVLFIPRHLTEQNSQRCKMEKHVPMTGSCNEANGIGIIIH
jgi:hypothetical protein